MARDEALATRVGEGASEPTLRLYRWAAPTLSLGYFQHFANVATLPAPLSALPVVRRLTGGGAILHDLELTYSVSLPLDHELVAGAPNRLYELAHEAVIAVLRDVGVAAAPAGVSDDSGAARGPFFCFARRHKYDVLIGADKLAGSAQRRTRTAVLQHGSIILGNRFAEQPTARLEQDFEALIPSVAAAFPAQFTATTRYETVPGEWGPEALRDADKLEAKYAGAEWTERT